MAYRGNRNAVGRGGASIRTAPTVGPWRRRLAMAGPGTARRCPPPRRRGHRTHTIKNKAPWNCPGQMDGFQSTWRPRVHVYANRHRAAPAGLIKLEPLDGDGVTVNPGRGSIAPDQTRGGDVRDAPDCVAPRRQRGNRGMGVEAELTEHREIVARSSTWLILPLLKIAPD